MARLNLTIPDSLYERLELVRDRINISKTCALALERELTMLEHTKVADEVVARVLSRLQTARDRWYKRGWDDASEWAAETATREELHIAATEMADWSGEEILEDVQFRPQYIPDSFPLDERLKYWGDRDQELQLQGTDSVAEDKIAYLEGWRDAVKEIWAAVSPSL